MSKSIVGIKKKTKKAKISRWNIKKLSNSVGMETKHGQARLRAELFHHYRNF